MKKLENVTKDSKREMDILDALDEVRMLNARNNDITTDQMLSDLRERAAKKEEKGAVKNTDADEEEVKNAFNKGDTIKRLEEEEDQGSAGPSSASAALSAKPTSLWGQNLQKQIAAKMEAQDVQQKKKKVGPRFAPLKRKVDGEAEPAEAAKEAPVASKAGGESDGDSAGSGGAGGLGLLAGYGSSGSGSGGSP